MRPAKLTEPVDWTPDTKYYTAQQPDQKQRTTASSPVIAHNAEPRLYAIMRNF